MTTTTTGRPVYRTPTPEQIDLVQRVLAQIETHPETWKQSTWRCETGMCFAGWAVELTGRRWAFPTDPNTPFGTVNSCLVLAEPDDEDAWRHWKSPIETIRVTSAGNVAARLLGLDEAEADTFFSAGNDLNQLRAYVRQYVAGEHVQYVSKPAAAEAALPQDEVL
jgi:hypothetical protein